MLFIEFLSIKKLKAHSLQVSLTHENGKVVLNAVQSLCVC